MNIVVEDKNAFYQFVGRACKKVGDQMFKVEPEYGEGYVHGYAVYEGLNIYVLDFVLNEPLLIRWDVESEIVNYYLFHNVVDEQNVTSNSKESTLEQGEVIFSDHNERRRLWLPNVRYKVLSVNFSYEWFSKVNETFKFPEQIWNNLQHTTRLYLHHAPTANTSLTSTQIKSELDQYSESSNTFLGIKCLELIYYVFNETLQSINEVKTKSSIHPYDLSKLNSFMGALYSKLDRTPDIKEAAEELGMSASKFQRLFKSLMGNTYYNYVFKMKMDAAMEQLLNKVPVSEVAYNLGYASIGNFTHAFKRCFDILPSAVNKSRG